MRLNWEKMKTIKQEGKAHTAQEMETQKGSKSQRLWAGLDSKLEMKM